jgi:hypothetical protein
VLVCASELVCLWRSLRCRLDLDLNVKVSNDGCVAGGGFNQVGSGPTLCKRVNVQANEQAHCTHHSFPDQPLHTLCLLGERDGTTIPRLRLAPWTAPCKCRLQMRQPAAPVFEIEPVLIRKSQCGRSKEISKRRGSFEGSYRVDSINVFTFKLCTLL